MGIIKKTFVFMLGTITGVYIAQNYNAPDVEKLMDIVIVIAKHVEQHYRK